MRIQLRIGPPVAARDDDAIIEMDQSPGLETADGGDLVPTGNGDHGPSDVPLAVVMSRDPERDRDGVSAPLQS
jgi:hypothetical protein